MTKKAPAMAGALLGSAALILVQAHSNFLLDTTSTSAKRYRFSALVSNLFPLGTSHSARHTDR